MKIEDPRSVNQSSNLHQTAPAGPAAARPEATRPQNDRAVSQPAARVELSSRSREMHQALEAAHAAPDVRSDKVNDAKQRIAQGTYSVNAEVVAKGILDTRA
jgi:flagellar biosynthesis anti-sigma factor FlgM